MLNMENGTGLPNVDSYARVAAADARIKAQNTWIRQMAVGGAWFLGDMAVVLENPASAGQILPAYDSWDGTHYSNAGYGGIAVQAALPV